MNKNNKLLLMLLVCASAQIMSSEDNKKIDTSKLTANQYRELLYSKSISEAIAFESGPVFDTNVFGELVQLTEQEVTANIAANREFLKNVIFKEAEQNNPYDDQLTFESQLGNSQMFWSHSCRSSDFWSASQQVRPERLYFDSAPGTVERSAYYMPPVVDEDVKDSSQNKKESAHNELNSEK